MLSAAFAFALYALSATAHGSSSLAPDCVTKCWTYSQYVSLSCAGNTKCLCEDSEFQNAVYQCLYSQCSTSKFGTALHHALGYCAGFDSNGLSPSSPSTEASPATTAAPAPPLIRNDPHKKRGEEGYVTKSVTRTSRQSVSASAWMTHSTARANPTVYEYQPVYTYAAEAWHNAKVYEKVVEAHPEAPPNAVYRMANDRTYREGIPAPHGKRNEPSKDL